VLQLLLQQQQVGPRSSVLLLDLPML